MTTPDINQLSAEAMFGRDDHPDWNPAHDLNDAARFAEWAKGNGHIGVATVVLGPISYAIAYERIDPLSKSGVAQSYSEDIAPDCPPATALTTAVLRAMGKDV